MKLTKYITRKYTLRDHALILESLYEKNTSIPELYYREVIDVSIKGLITIYVRRSDIEDNIKRLRRAANRSRYISQKIKEGESAVDGLRHLPFSALKKAHDLSDREIIKIIKLVKKKFFVFSGFFEFTHYIGRTGVELTPAQIKKLGNFHDQRKDAFMEAFYFLNTLFERKLRNSKIINKKLNFLTIDEIVNYFDHKIDEKYVNQEQGKRMKRYICVCKNQSERIVTDGFNKEFKSLGKRIEIIRINKTLKGNPINRGLVRGRVKIISQSTPYQEIPKNAVIVTPMSTPEMTPFLKKAKALITDEGGLLCHAAVFAREFKIITILGTKIATKILRDGDLVEVDANKGIVRKVS